MQTKTYQAGEPISEIGKRIESLMLITEGSAEAIYEAGKISLKKGDVIGITGIHHLHYLLAVNAVIPTTVAIYPYKAFDFLRCIEEKPETISYCVPSIFRQVVELLNQHKKLSDDSAYLFKFFTDSYAKYLKLCEDHRISPRALPGQDEIAPLVIEDDIEPWLSDGLRGLYDLVSHAPDSVKSNTHFYYGLINMMSNYICRFIVINNRFMEYQKNLLSFFVNEDHPDLFELFTSAYFRIFHLAEDEKPDPSLVNDTIAMLRQFGADKQEFCQTRIDECLEKMQHADQQKPADDEGGQDATAEIHGSLAIILEYAGCPDLINDDFTKQLKAYKATPNKSSTEDADRRVRTILSKHFYEVYNAAALKSLDDDDVPRVVKMFLHFGYVDEELAGLKNAAYLYNIVEHLPTDPERGVYTFYQWIQAIYAGKKEPSRNEFDNDFTDYVHELSRNNKINKTEEAEMLVDRRAKVTFELESLLPSVNKVTNGRITTFCPTFSEHYCLKTIQQMLLSVDVVEQTLAEITGKDFGAFCRDSTFADPEHGVVKEEIVTEVLPDVILTPNVGIRGVMWQEIEGKKRTTPSRFMLSLFQAEDYKKIFYRLTGEFRWEMCRRVQGARWNDTSEPSLTADYSDYLASYRKNNELSSDVKEKIKSDLAKVKNSTKEMFLLDYLGWMLFEANGSPRLNKVVRAIMIAYCPFTRDIRNKLKANPFYTEAMEKYDIRLKVKAKHYETLFAALKAKGFEVPPEIAETRRLILL
jgi:hypothetical protein